MIKDKLKFLRFLVILFLALNMMDYLSTAIGLYLGAGELNPFMDYLYSKNLFAPFLVKNLGAALLIFMINYNIKRHPQRLNSYVYGMFIICLVFVGAVINNINVCIIMWRGF